MAKKSSFVRKLGFQIPGAKGKAGKSYTPSGKFNVWGTIGRPKGKIKRGK